MAEPWLQDGRSSSGVGLAAAPWTVAIGTGVALGSVISGAGAMRTTPLTTSQW